MYKNLEMLAILEKKRKKETQTKAVSFVESKRRESDESYGYIVMFIPIENRRTTSGDLPISKWCDNETISTSEKLVLVTEINICD